MEINFMRVIIPFFGSRVAPNLLYSDQSLIVQIYRSKIVSKKIVSTMSFTENSWIKLIEEYGIQILICGGIDKNFHEELKNREIEVIKNVAGEFLISKEEAKSLVNAHRDDSLDTALNDLSVKNNQFKPDYVKLAIKDYFAKKCAY